MTYQILGEEEARGIGCVFQEYSKEKHKMCNCGNPVIANFGRNPLCMEHIVDALAFGSAGDYHSKKSATGGTVLFGTKEDFLGAAKEENKNRKR